MSKSLYPLDSRCVERFHHYRSNEKNIIASLLKFAGYINNHKMLHGNIFGFILKNKMAVRDVYSTLNKDFCWSSRAKGIIGRDLKFAGYVPHYKILTGNIYLPPVSPAGDYNLHHVCVSVRAWVTQFSLKLLQLHIFGKLLVPMNFYALQNFFGLVNCGLLLSE